MMTIVFLFLYLLSFTFTVASGDCNACPLGASSCPQTVSIDAGNSEIYSGSCQDPSYNTVVTGIQVAQEDGGDDDFTVTLMDDDALNEFKAGDSYKYYSSIGTGGVGQKSTTCYQYSGKVAFPAGKTLNTVIQCTNALETCHLRVKTDSTCQNSVIDPCLGVSCNSHGQCTSGVCDCQTGYSGSNCQNYDPCSGVNCGDNGVCSNGQCNCNTGYFGTNCQNYDPCSGVDCGDNGVCSNGQCNCNTGYSGTNCQVTSQCTEFQLFPCGLNGACQNGKCVCFSGYSGTHCQNSNPDPCLGVDCTGNGNCNNGNCVCHVGYSGLTCSETSDCSTLNCENGGTCIGGECICLGNYGGSDCSYIVNDNYERTIIIASCSAAGAVFLLLLIFGCLAAYARAQRRRMQSTVAMEGLPSPADATVPLVSAVEQQ